MEFAISVTYSSEVYDRIDHIIILLCIIIIAFSCTIIHYSTPVVHVNAKACDLDLPYGLDVHSD